MPKKKESVWTMGNKGPTGPWMWQVWIKGTKKPVAMSAFDLEHIQNQCEDKKVIKAKRLPEEKEDTRSEHLGPKGCVVNQPADYDKGFKILREWLDSVGGPPESVRKELRELFIDYNKVKQKTTTYSQKKNGQHKI